MLDRFSVARALREIASLMEVEGANPFKVRAYERGARALEGMPEDLGTLVREGRLTSVPGIGNALASTIAELFQTGRSPQLDRLRERLPPGVLELSQVLSLAKIGALHRALGIGSLADLETAARAGRIRDVKGFGDKTEQKILADIEALRTARHRDSPARGHPRGGRPAGPSARVPHGRARRGRGRAAAPAGDDRPPGRGGRLATRARPKPRSITPRATRRR